MLGVGLLGAGCAHIPTSGPVELRTLGVGSEPTGPYVRPRPPAEDAGPSEIILGFVSACVGSEDDFQVAREYLEESTRADWDPSAGVTLYAASREPGVERVDDQHFALTLQVVGSVDSNGVRNFLTAPVERDVTLRVVEAEEGWRISDPPPGIFLSDTYIEILYVTARVYFLTAPTWSRTCDGSRRTRVPRPLSRPSSQGRHRSSTGPWSVRCPRAPPSARGRSPGARAGASSSNCPT
jgi:hypothetical protein